MQWRGFILITLFTSPRKKLQAESKYLQFQSLTYIYAYL